MLNITALISATAADPINFTPIIYGFVAVLAFIGALKGLSRGIARQSVRSITIVISAIISFAAVAICYSRAEAFLADKTMADVYTWLVQGGIITEGSGLEWIINADIKTLELILTLPVALIVMPVLFVALFILVSAVMLIVHAIASALCGFKKRRNNIVTRFLGMALGLVQGLVVAGLILMPIVGIAGTAKAAVTTLKAEAPEEEITTTLSDGYDAYLKTVCENPCISLYDSLGIGALYESIATVELNGTEHNMTELTPDVTLIVCDAFELRGAQIRYLTPENEATIKSILDRVEGNPYLTELVAGAVKFASYAYTEDVITLPLDEPFASIVDSAVSIFHNSDKTNINADLETISEVLFILSRDGVLSSFDYGSDAMLDVLVKTDADGKTTINRIVDKINANERMKPLVTLISKVSVTVMAQQAGIGEEALEVYENIKGSLNNDILTIDKESFETEEEYVAEISGALDTALKDNNINLEPEIVDTMAQYISDNYSEIDEITDEEATSIILSYYDAYLEYLETNEIPEGLPGGNAD